MSAVRVALSSLTNAQRWPYAEEKLYLPTLNPSILTNDDDAARCASNNNQVWWNSPGPIIWRNDSCIIINGIFIPR
jgi:hypothetical protein